MQAEWDRRYAEGEQLWSGRPNGALVAEVAGLEPGRVLDVGCGEGADAVWLARRGWDVTALEVSGVALDARPGTRGTPVSADSLGARRAGRGALPPGPSTWSPRSTRPCCAPPTPRPSEPCSRPLRPGGVLLLVHHAGMDTQPVHDGGFDPADYVWPSMVAALLDDDWAVELDVQRPRVAPDGGAGAHHTDDVVLRARRLR